MKNLMISVSGKGGTGKTSIVALMLRHLIEKTDKIVLLVDADPATNLPDLLGITVRQTVGMAADQLKKNIAERSLSPTVPKERVLEGWVHQSLVEREKFDLLAMGRTEGEGCYCYVNSLLTRIVGSITKNYDIILMDMEAGLEHVSRRTDRDVDIMFVVTDGSMMGLNTAKRIKDLAEEMSIGFKKIYLIANMVPLSVESELRSKAKEIGLNLIGVIPYDGVLMEFNMRGKSVFDLPLDSDANIAVNKIMIHTGIIGRDE
jgi:CO dehydrogenase maturation factor